MSIRAVAAAAVLALSLATQALAQDGTWHDFMPPTRRGGTLVHDTKRDRYVMFAGSDGQLRNDVWMLSADSTQWRQLYPGGAQLPVPRTGAASVYDELHDRIWVYGGEALNALSATLFALDADPVEWLVVSNSGPGIRSQAALVRDPGRDRLILYGGITNKATRAATSDVWAIAPYSDSPGWKKLSAFGTAPTPRWGAVTIFDRVRDRLVVLGGQNKDSVLTDAWQLSFSPVPTWSRIVSVGNAPPAREGAIGVLDAARDRIVTFGGADPSSKLANKDVWMFSLSGFDAWERVQAADAPAALSEACAVMDSARARIVIHGGGRPSELTASYPSNETRTLDVSGTPAWGRITPEAPLPRHGAGAAYDLPHDAFWVFGGLTSVDGAITYSNELWRANLAHPGEWSLVQPSGPTPSGRHEASLAYDARANRLFMFGGWNGATLGDTWTFDPGGVWRPVATGSGPKPRRAQASAWDPSRRALFVFGGADAESTFNDAWELSTDGTIAWRRIDADGDAPEPRGWASAVYDPFGDRIVIYGGLIQGISQDDVWSLSLGGRPRWTRLTTNSDSIGSRTRHMAAYDPQRRRMLVWGGYTANAETQHLTPGTFALALDGDPVWSKLSTTGPEPPAAAAPAMVYDMRRDRIVTYGGSALFDDLLPDLRALEFGGTGAAAWLAGARVEGESVRLAWQTVEAPGSPASVEKRVDAYGDEPRSPLDPPAGSWVTALATTVASDGGVTWTDAHVGGGGAYSYRLVVGGAPTNVTSIVVPAIPKFALENVLPSPTTGPVVMAIRSTGAAPVWATLYDANGRRVLVRELGLLPAGLQSVPLELPAGRRAGVYFLRVTQGGSAATRKIVVF